jgi:hypothetical protein
MTGFAIQTLWSSGQLSCFTITRAQFQILAHGLASPWILPVLWNTYREYLELGYDRQLTHPLQCMIQQSSIRFYIPSQHISVIK